MQHGGDIYRNRIDLDFSVNLNPNGQPDKLQREMKKAISLSDTYPDYYQEKLRRAIAGAEEVGFENVYAGNGASELINAVVRLISPKNVLLISPGFSGYRHSLLPFLDVKVHEHFLDRGNDFVLDESLLPKIDSNTDLLFLTNPNNPTGRNIEEKLLYKILERARDKKVKVILDESFLGISKSYSVNHSNKLISEFENLYIISGYTKTFSVPGIRIGYVISNSKSIEEIISLLPEWNVSQIADCIGRCCADIAANTDFYKKSNDYIEEEREFVAKQLENMGIETFKSDSAFLLVYSKSDLYSKLLKKGILIRSCNDFSGLGSGYYRIAIRNHSANMRLIDAISGELYGN